MSESELRETIVEAFNDYFKDTEWKPDLLRHFSGHLFFFLLRIKKIPVTHVSVNLRFDGLSALIRFEGEKTKTEVEFFYEVKRAGTGFVARLIGGGMSGSVEKGS